MAQRYAAGHDALAECDVCGFRYYLRELRNVVRNRVRTNIKACPECWDEDHPQNHLGERPVEDAQAIRDPRPDFAGYGSSRALRLLQTANYVHVKVGVVTVTTS